MTGATMAHARLKRVTLSILALAIASTAYVFTPTFGRTYPLKSSVVQDALLKTAVPKVFYDLRLQLRLVESDAAHVAWELNTGKGPSVSLVARVEDAPQDATKVTVLATLPETADRQRSLFVDATMKKLFESAFTEQIASTLDRRQFQVFRLTPDLGLMMAMNLVSIVKNRDRVAAEDRKRMQAAGAAKP